MVCRNNSELLGVYGNLVNRTLVFAKKYYDSRIPKGEIEPHIKVEIELLYKKVGEFIEKGNLKIAIDEIFDFVRSINKYFDEKTPWITINADKDQCANTIYNCLIAIINIANLLHPFLLFSSAKVKNWLNCDVKTWEYTNLEIGYKIEGFDILFERLDKEIIRDELSKLGSNYSD